MKKQGKNIIILLLVTFLVFYLIMKDDFSTKLNLILSMNKWWLLCAVLFILAYWLLQTISLHAITPDNDDKPSFWTLLKSTIICNFFSAITPSATGGQPFQIYFLKKNGLHLGTATNLVVSQSTLYQIALVIFGTFAIILNYFFDFFPNDLVLKKLVIIGYIVNVLVIVLLIFVSRSKKASRFLIMKIIRFLHKIKLLRNVDKMQNKVDNTIEKFYDSSIALGNNKKIIFKGIVYNLLAFVCLYIVPLFVFYALGNYGNINGLEVLVSSAYVMLIGAFVPIPGGSGGIEYAFINFFGFFITGSKLLAILLMWRFITYYLSIIIGAIVLVLNKNRGEKI